MIKNDELYTWKKLPALELQYTTSYKICYSILWMIYRRKPMQGRLSLAGLARFLFQGAVFCTLKPLENESPSCVCTFVYISINCKSNIISSIQVLITIFRPECIKMLFFTFILGIEKRHAWENSGDTWRVPAVWVPGDRVSPPHHSVVQRWPWHHKWQPLRVWLFSRWDYHHGDLQCDREGPGGLLLQGRELGGLGRHSCFPKRQG